MSELVQRGSDLLLLRGDLVRLTELLAETLLAGEVQAAIAEPELPLPDLTKGRVTEGRVTEGRVTETRIAELLTDSLMRAIAAHHSSSAEKRGRQGLSEERCVVSVRQ